MPTITKIILKNFKKFESLTLNFDSGTNVLIGDNETGKSSVLLALDLVLSASRTRVETLGIEALLNRSAVEAFLKGNKRMELLPELIVDVYLEEGTDPALYGTQNSTLTQTDGLRMSISPIDEYGPAILEVLADGYENFPYEYYSVKFLTFSGGPYESTRLL